MKGKKLYYVPGLFSIIGLPILLFLIGPRDPDRHTSITMRLPSDDHTAGKFNRDDLLASIKNKKIETIDLDYPSFVDYDEYYEVVSAHRFRFVTQEIERLAFTHDTSTVLKVDLGENNSYGDFVWLYNHMGFYRLQRYAFVDNSFYVLSNYPTPHNSTEPLVAGEAVLRDLPPPPTQWQKFKDEVRHQIRKASGLTSLYWKNSPLLILGFLLLILFPSFIRIRRRWVNS